MPCTRRQLDLNTCTADQLTNIHGVSKPLARRIIAQRKLVGYFTKLDDLVSVRGVGDRLFSRISDHVYVLPLASSSRRSSRVSSSASSPARRRPRPRSSSTVGSRNLRDRRVSPKRGKQTPLGQRPIRKSTRGSSLGRVSHGSSSLPSLRSRGKSPTRRSKQGKVKLKSAFENGPIQVDSAQNISINLDELAKKGCNLTLCSGKEANNGQSRPLLTINVRELESPSLKVAVSSGDRPVSRPTSSLSPERVPRNSSVIDEDVREYLVIRDTKRKTETLNKFEPGPSNLSDIQIEQVSVDPPLHPISSSSSSPRRKGKSSTKRQNSMSSRRSSLRRSSPTRNQALRFSPSRLGKGPKYAPSGRSSPQRNSPRRDGSRRHSSTRPRNERGTSGHGRLSRSDIENWLVETNTRLGVGEEAVDSPLASSTPRRKKRERSRSPVMRKEDIPGPSGLNKRRSRESSATPDRPSKSPDQARTAVGDGGRSYRDGNSAKRHAGRDRGSPRKDLRSYLDDVGTDNKHQPTMPDNSQDITVDDADNIPEETRTDRHDHTGRTDEDQLRPHRRRHHHHHRSRTDQRPHENRRNREVDSRGVGAWCSVL